jgi:hypothetical protein
MQFKFDDQERFLNSGERFFNCYPSFDPKFRMLSNLGHGNKPLLVPIYKLHHFMLVILLSPALIEFPVLKRDHLPVLTVFVPLFVVTTATTTAIFIPCFSVYAQQMAASFCFIS